MARVSFCDTKCSKMKRSKTRLRVCSGLVRQVQTQLNLLGQHSGPDSAEFLSAYATRPNEGGSQSTTLSALVTTWTNVAKNQQQPRAA